MGPITGTWLDLQHAHAVEGKYFNPQLAAFTAEQWQAKVEEMCDLGMTTLVVMAVAQAGQAFYPSRIMPRRREMACADPLEAVLQAADRRGAHVFIGVGFFQGDINETEPDPVERGLRRAVPRELLALYGHHPSCHGWYLPVEAPIRGHFHDRFLRYARSLSADLRQLTSARPILIAPYGTRTIVPDDRYVAQIKSLGVDFIAYQDEVGVAKTRPGELERIWQRVRAAHDAAGIPLWADVELFRFEGEVYKSALLPAPLERIAQQLAAAARYADKILCYQYPGLMDHPQSRASAGHPTARLLYEQYVAYYHRAP